GAQARFPTRPSSDLQTHCQAVGRYPFAVIRLLFARRSRRLPYALSPLPSVPPRHNLRLCGNRNGYKASQPSRTRLPIFIPMPAMRTTSPSHSPSELCYFTIPDLDQPTPVRPARMFMDHTRKTSFLFGLFFAGTFVFAIPAPFLYSSLLDGPGDIHLQGLETRIALGACTQVLLTICNVATAVVLFPLARRYSETLAFGYLAVRIIESLIILTGDISLLSVITLRNALPDAGTADAFNTAHHALLDRKSTRLNSSHVKISYAVFCLK